MLHQIGVGALGPVFRTYEPARDRLVAVKVFRLDITPEQARTLADELSRAAEAGLFHPSIVEPLAAGVEGTVAYRAEEYVAAESLDVAMRHYAPAPLDKVLPFITQLAGAIDFARAAGIGHGALHPRDIFVTPDEARATGFGVVDALERVGQRAPVRRPYSAPERIAGDAWGTAADVFSLAAIAFELLTGRRPSGTGAQLGAIPGDERLRDVFARAMDEDPDARYKTALAFASALEHGARGGVEAAGSAFVDRPRTAVPVPASAPADVAPADAASEPVAPAAISFDAAPDAEGPPAAATPVPPPAEPDDIAAERDEDEAHWALSEQESREIQIEAEAPASLFDDREEALAADELALDAADLALGDERGARDNVEAFPSERVESDDPAPLDAPDLLAARREGTYRGASITPIERHQPRRPSPRYGDLPLAAAPIPRGETEPRRTAMLPIAVTLLVGLLLGFAVAYGILDGGGPPSTGAAESAAGQPNPEGGTGTGGSTAPSREFSEESVAPPSRPAAAAPPAAAPDVPSDEERAADKPVAVRPPARPQPATGRLTVRSTPSGASVTLNGRWRGRTPITLDELALGDYVVRIVAPGYEVAREELKLSANQTSRTITRRLARDRSSAARGAATRPPARPATYVGSVYVDSRPRGAKVLVDGKNFGTTPLRIPELGIGSHVVRLELPNHRPWTNSIRVTAGAETTVSGSLEPIR